MSANDMMLFILLAFAYLCGSVPFGKLVGRAQGVDIQKRGSGNIGFANVRRVLGWKAGLLTLAGDIAKGALPTWLALEFGNAQVAFWVGLVAIAGHLFPVWLRFRGGKGMATGLGMLAIIQPVTALVGIGVYLVGCLVWRNSARSSLVGLICLGVVGTMLRAGDWWHYGLLLAIALWTHRHNLTGKLPNYDV